MISRVGDGQETRGGNGRHLIEKAVVGRIHLERGNGLGQAHADQKLNGRKCRTMDVA